jgi:hypothetical protein
MDRREKGILALGLPSYTLEVGFRDALPRYEALLRDSDPVVLREVLMAIPRTDIAMKRNGHVEYGRTLLLKLKPLVSEQLDNPVLVYVGLHEKPSCLF